MQFHMGSYAKPVEQDGLARPAIPQHLRHNMDPPDDAISHAIKTAIPCENEKMFI